MAPAPAFLVAALLLAVLTAPQQVTAQPAPAGTSSSDVDTLLAFRSLFSNGESVLNWTETDTSPCGWPGITCDGRGRVKQMYLGNKALKGTMPPEGLPLPDSLQELYLFNSRISGSLPEQWVLPPDLSILQLSDNRLNGSLPALALPGGMAKLYLSGNQLSGTLPPQWDLPADLVELDLAVNNFSGRLPTWPSAPSAGVHIDPGNSFCGEVPDTPKYVTWNTTLVYNSKTTQVQSLPPCPPGTPAVSPVVPSSPAQQPTQDSSSGSSSSSSNTAVIAGAVAGAVGAVVIICLLLWWWRRRQRQQRAGQQGAVKRLEQSSDKVDTVDSDTSRSGKKSAIEFGPGTANGKERQDISIPISDGPTSAWSSNETQNGESEVDLSSLGSDWTAKSIGDPCQWRESHAQLLSTNPVLSSIASRLPPSSTAVSSAVATAGSLKSAPSTASSGCLSKGPSLDIQPWTIQFQDLLFQREIGSGSFGVVYLAVWHETLVAVKILLGGGSSSLGSIMAAAHAVDQVLTSHPLLENLQQEASMMALLRHPNVLSFLGVCSQPPCLVSEFCPRGSLYDILSKARSDPMLGRRLDWMRRITMALGAAKGVLHLHSRNPAIIHRDLKSPNLLVSDNWVVKVSDFNLSRICEDSPIASSMAVTNPRWLAPEVLAGGSHSAASDSFAFGVVLWELLTFELPWNDVSNPWQVAKFVVDGGRLDIPPHAPGLLLSEGFPGLMDYVALIHSCWAQEPQDRPSLSHIIAELRRLLGVARDGRQASPRTAHSMPSPANPPTKPPPKPAASTPGVLEEPCSSGLSSGGQPAPA